MKKKIIFVLLIAVIVFFLLVGIDSFVNEPPKEIKTINYTFSVKEGVGFNLDTDKLNFGGGPADATLQRKVNISSTFNSVVHIESEGLGSLILSQNDFELSKDQSEELLFGLIVPQNLSLGSYEGTIFIYLYEQ